MMPKLLIVKPYLESRIFSINIFYICNVKSLFFRAFAHPCLLKTIRVDAMEDFKTAPLTVDPGEVLYQCYGTLWYPNGSLWWESKLVWMQVLSLASEPPGKKGLEVLQSVLLIRRQLVSKDPDQKLHWWVCNTLFAFISWTFLFLRGAGCFCGCRLHTWTGLGWFI